MHEIESAKGWSTQEILDLPLCRVRQLLELISQEKRHELKVHTQLIEWQTKQICAMFISMSEDPKQAKKLQRHVEKMKLPLDDEEADVFDNRSFEDVVENGAMIDVSKQPSFEDLQVAFQNM